MNCIFCLSIFNQIFILRKATYQSFKLPKYELSCIFIIAEQDLYDQAENAPETIRKRYDTAYNYEIGDLRCLLSFKIPDFVLFI